MTDERKTSELDNTLGEDTENRRRYERKRLTAKVDLKGENQFWAGFTENISEGGLFVATQAPFELGTKIDLVLNLAGRLGKEPIPCVVRWIRPDTGGGLPPGMGLEFAGISEEAREQIVEFVESGRLEVLFWED